MNKKYNENKIQELLKVASKNTAPDKRAFDVLLAKLDTSIVKKSVYTKPITSTFSFFKFAGAFTAFVFVILSVRNMSTTPLEESVNPNGPLATSVGIDRVETEETRIVATNLGLQTSADNISGRVMSASFAKNISESPEVSALEDVALSGLSAESGADSELLALDPGI